MFKKYILTICDALIGVIEFLLSIRVLLKLLGASTKAPFVTWIYETTKPLLTPFEGMFPTSSISTGLILEMSTLFAIITYAFLGVLLETIIYQLTPQTHK